MCVYVKSTPRTSKHASESLAGYSPSFLEKVTAAVGKGGGDKINTDA